MPASARLACVAISGLLVLTGCSVAAGGSSSVEGMTEAGAVVESSVELDNCGTTVRVSSPPQRVVTIKSTATEMLLALGLGARIVGSASSDGPLPPEFASATPPVLAEKLPSKEAVLTVRPDLVFAGWESNFSTEGAGERESLQGMGIHTYVSPAACKTPGYKPSPLTFDGVFEDIEEAGRLFGAQPAAEKLVSSQRAQLAALRPNTSGFTALWYSSGGDTPYVGAGSGAPQMMMEAAGLVNIAADVDDTWSPLSWEVIAERNPAVIVLIDSTWASAAKKIATLENNPVMAKLPAVQNKRYVVLPFASSEAGVRNVAAVASMIEQLGSLDASR